MAEATPQPTYLSQLKKKEIAIISGFCDNELASKLMAMGILPNSRVEVCMASTFKGGCIVKVDNQKIALRSSEAMCILVSK